MRAGVRIDVIGVTDPDGDPVTIRISGIFQDEPASSRRTNPSSRFASSTVTAFQNSSARMPSRHCSPVQPDPVRRRPHRTDLPRALRAPRRGTMPRAAMNPLTRAPALALFAVFCLGHVTAGQSAATARAEWQDVEVIRTAHGVPHIRAANLRAGGARSLAEWTDAMRMRVPVTSNFSYADRTGNIFSLWKR